MSVSKQHLLATSKFLHVFNFTDKYVQKKKIKNLPKSNFFFIKNAEFLTCKYEKNLLPAHSALLSGGITTCTYCFYTRFETSLHIQKVNHLEYCKCSN